MAESTDSKKRLVDLPWATIVAIVAASTGFFLYLNPLQTSRPPERAGFHSDVDRPEDVDARLWQDPLRAASEHEDNMQAKYKDSAEQREREDAHHQTGYLLGQFHQRSDFWVLAVMIPGSSYAEYAETRLRARQAVLEGLGAERYVPVDNEHIGYVKIDEPQWGWHNVILPYEWCHRDLSTKNNNGLPDDVCVLWLRDEEFWRDEQHNGPLFQLDRLLRDPRYLDLDTSWVKTRVIGPFSSTTLRRMVKEVAAFSEPRLLLENVEMWCATATAADQLLLQKTSGADSPHNVEELFHKKFTANPTSQSFEFTRSIKTDDEVAQTLVDELQNNRGLDIAPDVHGSKEKEGKDRVAVISEWDTFFGRALPLSIRHAILNALPFDELVVTRAPENVLAFSYLRGIDGMLPGSAAPSEAKSKGDQPKTAVPRESTEGLNQADYLRRLSGELSQLDADLRRTEGAGIRAIGVLGGDVYDKLLVLQALRKTFPDTIFFTNNLDARFAHPDEWRWTRNLLIASPFGLTLKNEFQKVPPFRDSNQTAIYTATLLIAQGEPAAKFDKNRLGPVRLYEVGRRGLFDLTHDETPQGLQPDSADMKRWWNSSRWIFASGILLLVIVALVWIFRIILGRPSPAVRPDCYRRAQPHSHPNVLSKLKGVWALLRWRFWRRTRSSRRVFGSSWTMVGVLTAVSVFSIWFINLCDPHKTEPYSWNDGISVWPTETLRLLICLLSAFYVLKTCVMLWQNERYLELHYGLQHCHFKRKTAPPQKQWKQWWRDRVRSWRDLLTVRYWQCERNGCVDPQKLWDLYANSGRDGVRFVRILPLAMCYFAAGYLLLLLLGWPEVPARGAYARGWDWIFARLSAFSVVLLTFFVADATLLNRRLIGYLTRGTTDWPQQAFNNLRARWSRSGRPMQGEAKEESQESQSVEPVPPNNLLVDYLDIDFIARRTAVVGGLIYYPFVVISLLIFSRAGIFDYWTWPLPLLLLMGFSVAYAAFSAAYLRRTAERARQQALQRLNDLLIAHVASEGESKDVQTIRETAKLIRNECRGAFAAVSERPLLGALLLPSGTAGIWALLQYFPRLLSS